MGLLDLLGAAAGTVDALQTKKKYPDDWPVFNLLSVSLASHNLDFQKAPGELVWVSKMRRKGLQMHDFKTAAIVAPSSQRVVVNYYPQTRVPEAYDYPLVEFITRMNAFMPAGRFEIEGKSVHRLTGKVGLDLVYTVGLSYAGHAKQVNQKLLDNLVRAVVEVAEAVQPGIEFLSKEGDAPGAVKRVGSVEKAAKKPSAGAAKRLLETLGHVLSAAPLGFELLSDGTAFVLARTGSDKSPISQHVLRATENSRVVFESYLGEPVPESARRRVANFLVVVNDKLTGLGTMVMDYETGGLRYRSSLDARDIEDKIDAGLIVNMLSDHLDREDLAFACIRNAIAGMPPEEALKAAVHEALGESAAANFMLTALGRANDAEVNAEEVTFSEETVSDTPLPSQAAEPETTKACPKCGAANAVTYKFCLKCGQPLG